MTELPEPEFLGRDEADEAIYGYTEADLRDYGRAEYLRGLNEAIDIVEKHNYGIAPSVILAHLRSLGGKT